VVKSYETTQHICESCGFISYHLSSVNGALVLVDTSNFATQYLVKKYHST